MAAKCIIEQEKNEPGLEPLAVEDSHTGDPLIRPSGTFSPAGRGR